MEESCKANEPCHEKTIHDECCVMPDKLLCLADCAWYEVLREMMKDEIRKSCGDQIQKIAKLAVETDKAKWEHRIKEKVVRDEYRQNLNNLFSTICGGK